MELKDKYTERMWNIMLPVYLRFHRSMRSHKVHKLFKNVGEWKICGFVFNLSNSPWIIIIYFSYSSGNLVMLKFVTEFRCVYGNRFMNRFSKGGFTTLRIFIFYIHFTWLRKINIDVDFKGKHDVDKWNLLDSTFLMIILRWWWIRK